MLAVDRRTSRDENQHVTWSDDLFVFSLSFLFWRQQSQNFVRRQERTNWFNLTFYGKLAHVAMQFEKGDNIHITAFLEHREWETKAGGKRNTYEVVVKKCHRIASARAQSHGAEEDNLGPDSGTAQGTEGVLASSQTDDGWVV